MHTSWKENADPYGFIICLISIFYPYYGANYILIGTITDFFSWLANEPPGPSFLKNCLRKFVRVFAPSKTFHFHARRPPHTRLARNCTRSFKQGLSTRCLDYPFDCPVNPCESQRRRYVRGAAFFHFRSDWRSNIRTGVTSWSDTSTVGTGTTLHSRGEYSLSQFTERRIYQIASLVMDAVVKSSAPMLKCLWSYPSLPCIAICARWHSFYLIIEADASMTKART